MAKLSITKGATSVMVRIFVQDSTSTTGAGKTGLTSTSFTGTKAYVARDDDGNAAGTSLTLTDSTRGTWSSGGIKEKDATNMPGVYELGLSNASLASGSRSCTYFLTGSGIVPVILEIELTGVDNQDAVHGGMSAIPNTACTTNASLLTSGTGTDQLSVSGGRSKADVTHLLGTAWLTPGTAGTPDVNAKLFAGLTTVALPLVPTTAGRTLDVAATGEAGLDFDNIHDASGAHTLTNIRVPNVTLADTVTTYTGNTVQTGDGYAIVNSGTYGNAQLVRATTPANTLDVSTTGEAGLDFNNIKDATGAHTLTNIRVPNVTLADTVTTYTGNSVQTGDAYARVGAAGAGLTALGDSRIAHLDADMTSRMATYTQPAGFLAATFPAGTVAGATDVTAIKARTDKSVLPASTGLTLQSATANTAVLDSSEPGASADTDIYKGMWLYMPPGGSRAPQCRLIVGYDKNSQTCTLLRNWARTPTAGDPYQVLPSAVIFADVQFADEVALSTHAAGMLPSDVRDIAGAAVNTAVAQLGVNVVSYASGQAPLQPTVAGRTLDVAATGEAGLDFDNIHDASGVHTLTNIRVPNVTLVDTLTTYTGNTVQTADVAAVKTATDQFRFTVANQVDANALTGGGGGGGDTPGTTTLLGRLTSGRAGNLDNLDAPVSAVKTQTDKMAFTAAGFIDANMKRVDDVALGTHTAGYAPADARRWVGGAIPTPLTTGCPKLSIPEGNVWKSSVIVDQSGMTLSQFALPSWAIPYPTDYFVGMRIRLWSSNPGEERTVTAYDHVTVVATVDRPWTATPNAGDPFAVMWDDEVAASGGGGGSDTPGTTTLLARLPGIVQPQTGDAYAAITAVRERTDLIPDEPLDEASMLGVLDTQGYTADRAEKLDHLDVDVSSVSGGGGPGGGADTPGVTTLLARIPGVVQPQSGDAYARGAVILTDTAAIKVKTNLLPATPANEANVETHVSNVLATLGITGAIFSSATIMGIPAEEFFDTILAAVAGKSEGVSTLTEVYYGRQGDRRFTTDFDVNLNRETVTYG